MDDDISSGGSWIPCVKDEMRGNIVMKTLKFFGLLVLFVPSVQPNVFTVPTMVQKLFLDEVKLVNFLMGEASIKGDPEVAK